MRTFALLPFAVLVLAPTAALAEMPWGIEFDQHAMLAAKPNKQVASWAYALTWLDKLMEEDARWLFRFHRSEQQPRVVYLRDTAVQQVLTRYSAYDQYMANYRPAPQTAAERMTQRKGAIANSATAKSFQRLVVDAKCGEFVPPATVADAAARLLETLSDDVPIYLLVNLKARKANGMDVSATVAICGQRIAGKGVHAGMFDPQRSESFYWNLSATEITTWLNTRLKTTLQAESYSRISWVAMKRQTRTPLEKWQEKFDQSERLSTKPNKAGVCWSYSLAWIDVLAARENLSLLRYHPAEVKQRFNLIGLAGTTDNLITRYDRFGAYWTANAPARRDMDGPWLDFQAACISNDRPISTYERELQRKKCQVYRNQGMAVYGNKLFEAFQANGPAYYMIYIAGQTGAHQVAAYAENLQGRGTFAACFDPNQGEVVYDQITAPATQVWLSKVCETVGWTGPNAVSEVSWVVLTKRP